MQVDHKTPLVFIDLETTGTSPRASRVIEIGIIRIESGEVVREYRTFVNPGELVPDFVASLTGITNAMLVDAPPFDEVAREVAELIEGGLFIAHNAPFDYGFLGEEFRRLGIPFSAPYLCTAKLSRALYPEYDRHNLDSIIERYNLDPGSRHRALDDARVLWQFIRTSYASLGEPLVHDMMHEQVRVRHLPVHVSEEVVHALPERPGVYIFYGKRDEVLYVGKSRRIRTRVRAHFAKDGLSSHGKDMLSQIRRIEYRETAGELGALLLESHLVESLSPAYNVKTEVYGTCVVALEARTEAGYSTVSVTHTDVVNPGDEHTIASLFKTRDHARSVLMQIAHEHRLCRYLLGLETETPCSGHTSGTCDGACVGKEKSRHHNKRFRDAFEHHRIKPWPFQGPVVLEERYQDGIGELFIVDKWRLLTALHNSGTEWEEFVPARFHFDYDIYKIFSRELSKRHPRLSVRELSNREEALLRGEYTIIT